MQPSWPSEYIVLALLDEQPMHGYELHQRICADEALRAIWRIQRSQLYFLLGKLQRRGYIVESDEQQVGGPPRLIYTPTPEGRVALAEWLAAPEQYPHAIRAAFLAKLYLVLRTRPAAAAGLIEAQRQVLHSWSAHQRQRAGGVDFAALVHRLRLGQIEAALAWLEELAAAVLTGRLLLDLPGTLKPTIPGQPA